MFHRHIVVGIPFASSLLGKALLVGLPNRLRRRKQQRASFATQNGDGSGNGQAGANGDGRGSTSAVTAAVAALNRASGVVPTVLPQAVPPLPLPSPRNLDLKPLAAASTATSTSPLHRLRALVLLGGSVRPTALGLASGRSVLDLPLDESGSVLTGWLDQAVDLALAIGIEKLPVRVMVNHKSPEPASADSRHNGSFRVERDLSEYRGTGGVLRDVANAAQILVEPLSAIVAALEKTGGDVSVVSHEDGTPSGIMLVACKTLRLIAQAGYVDMKEQALPQIAAQFDVRVLSRRRPTGHSIRTLEDYVHALRYHHRRKTAKPGIGAAGGGGSDSPGDDWNPLFSLVETGATVDPSARIHDSVVLAGGVVEAGAVLVRSVVCPGGVLRRDKTAMEAFVTSDDSASRSNGRSAKARGGKTRVPAAALATAAGANGAAPAALARSVAARAGS